MSIEEFQWDDRNEEHVARRGFNRVQLSAVLEGEYLILRNKNDATGDYRLIGRDRGGRLVTIVIKATHIAGTWRPITAWPSNASEENYAKRHGI